MKLEKTCKCVKTSSFLKGETTGEICTFIEGREYQLDVFTSLSNNEFYKIYQNGGYDDWAILDFNQFSENFEEIK